LAIIKKQWIVAKVFSGAVVFPAFLVSGFFVFNYAQQVAADYLTQVAMLSSAIVLGLSLSVFLSPQLLKKIRKGR
jgi:hypothetical protein